MNKILLMLVALFVGFVARADYLYWMLDASDYTGAGDDDVVTAQFKQSSESGTSTVQAYALVWDSDEEEWVRSEDATTTLYPGVTYAVEESAINTAEGYSYYVELYNNNTIVENYGGSENSISGDEFKSYVATANESISADLEDGAELVIPVYHASSGSMSTIPEPTSAILMLFGAALLGLKRKNRSIA